MPLATGTRLGSYEIIAPLGAGDGTDANGNQDVPNPNYKLPKAYQPPMAARVGMQVSL